MILIIEKLVRQIFSDYKPLNVINFAAETHVDTSISSPRKFIKSNIEGTFNLLENALHFWKSCENQEKLNFKFLQVSTDEVFGSLSKIEPSLMKQVNIILITHIQQVKQAQIILLEHSIKLTVYQQLYQTVLIIMVHFNNQKN